MPLSEPIWNYYQRSFVTSTCGKFLEKCPKQQWDIETWGSLTSSDKNSIFRNSYIRWSGRLITPWTLFRGSFIQPFCRWGWSITGELCKHQDSWCPCSLYRQVIKRSGIGYKKIIWSRLLWKWISITNLCFETKTFLTTGDIRRVNFWR